MQRIHFLVFCMGLGCAGLGSAAVVAEPAPPIIAPPAQAVIDRVRAAYSTGDGWSATSVRETHHTRNGTEEVAWMKETERYLPGAGGLSHYLYTLSLKDVPRLAIGQNHEEHYMVSRLPNGSFEASISVPVEENRPKLWAAFELVLARCQYVNYLGQEIVAGETCDWVDCVSVLAPSATPGQTKPTPRFYNESYYVNSVGFIVQQRTALNGSTHTWSRVRVTYDPQARPTVADFSREAFDAEAARLLRPGERKPVLIPALFKPGQRLPDMTFIDWADQRRFRFSDLQGKVVVVETWASWCGSCKEAFPFYEKVRKKLAARDVVFVAVSFDHDVAAYEKWMKANAAGYGFKFGLVEAADAKAAMKEFKGALPAFYVLGRDGRIVSSYGGYGLGVFADDPRLFKALGEAGITVRD